MTVIALEAGAPEGTVAIILVGEAEVTVAVTPPNFTVFWLGVEENPVPEMVTDVPVGPVLGVNSRTETIDADCRTIEVRFPTASYE